MAGFLDGAFGQLGGGILPPWLTETIAGLQQGGSAMLTGQPQQQLPPLGNQQAPVAAPAPMPQGDIGGGQPQMTPPAPQQPAMPPPGLPPPNSPGIGDRLNAGLMGFAHSGGPLPAIANMISGLMTGQRSDPAGMMMANRDVLAKALVSSGIPPQVAMAAASNPKLAEVIFARAFPELKPHNVGDVVGAWDSTRGTYSPQFAAPKTEKVGAGDSLVSVAPNIPGLPPGRGAPGRVTTLLEGGAKPDDVSGMRKEITALPEVKRYSESLPVFRSMIKSSATDSAAADLDFVYGVAKIFDPDSVVREGEMKLVGKAQSIPEDVQGLIKRVAFGEGRLTPEARARILQVARTRMGELKGSLDERLSPYHETAKRGKINPADVMPRFQDLPDAPQAKVPTAAAGAPPEPAVQALRKNPALAEQFDVKYGAGSAARILNPGFR